MAIAEGSSYNVTIVSVTDGDTFRATFPDGQTRYCRLFGIDAPESVYASTSYPTAYPSLPAELQIQEFGAAASARLSTVLIGGTGAPTAVGLTVAVLVRDIDSYGRAVVTVTNDLAQDVGEQMLRSGHAVVWDTYASTVPSVHSLYQTAQAVASNANLVMWSNDEVYNPWDYRADVDEAAERILYLRVESTVPALNSTDCYLDDDIIITFDQEMESSYLSSNYFKFYRTNSTSSEFEAVGCTYEKNGNIITVDPVTNLLPNEYYMLVIVGGTSGIKALDTSAMNGNYVLTFRAGTIVRPMAAEEENVGISHVDLWVDADHTDDQTPVSTNLFAVSESEQAIVLVSTIPANHSVGVYGVNRIIFTYNDTLAYAVPTNALSGRYSDLPIDTDPLGIRSVFVSGSVAEHNMLIFDIEELSADDTLNREYTFTLAPNVARGNTYQAYDTETHVIKFMGRLTPLYATPDQIRARLTSWHSELDAGIIDYDLYKLIHEKSIWSDNHAGGPPATTEALIDRNRLVICLVLYEMFTLGVMLSGGVKSRMVLMTQVEYFNINYAALLTELKSCITSSISATGGNLSLIQTGIKSGQHLDRVGKNYSVYR